MFIERGFVEVKGKYEQRRVLPVVDVGEFGVVRRDLFEDCLRD